MQRGDVTVADEDFGVGADGPVVQPRQEARGAVAAAHADNGLHLAVREHLHEVARAVAVVAGKESPTLADIKSELRFEAEALEDGDGAVDVLGIRRRACGCNDSDGVAVVQTAVWWASVETLRGRVIGCGA